MTYERLQSLPFASLLEIAAKEGIDVPEGTDREALIEEIQEALEEDRDEREQANNFVMRIKEKKFDVAQDEELESQEKTDFQLPDRYNETRIVALLRDPTWAFAYWDLKDSEIEPLQAAPDFEGFFLRVHESHRRELGARDDATYFDIPVQSTDSSWYINLPNPGESYWIELCCSVAEKVHALCHSNTIRSPLGEVAMDFLHDMFGGSDSDVLALAGLNERSLSSIRDTIPQRIISLLDEDYLESKESESGRR